MADVLSFIGAFRNTQAANAQAEGLANEAKMNAEIMMQNAALEKSRQDRELRDNRRKYNLLTGQSRAQAGALGIFGGSSLDVLADISTQGIFEQQSIVEERVSARQNYFNQAASYKARASNLLASRQSPWLNGTMAAISTMVDMAGSAVGMSSNSSQHFTGQNSAPSSLGGGSVAGGGSFDYNTGTSTSDGFA